MEEVWLPVNSTRGLIEVSSLGRARRVERELIYKDGRKGVTKAGLLRGTVIKTGYVSISFGKSRLFLHRLVAEAFHGIPDESHAYQTVNHINGNKTDNRPENLEWASYKSNNSHARSAGLNNQHGERTNLSKHSDQFIAAVRNVYAAYHPNWEQLGKMFGITGCHARQIVLNLTRKKPTI